MRQVGGEGGDGGGCGGTCSACGGQTGHVSWSWRNLGCPSFDGLNRVSFECQRENGEGMVNGA